MKMDYTAPEMELICLVSAQKLADATIPYNDIQGGSHEVVNPGSSYTQGDTEVDIPIW